MTRVLQVVTTTDRRGAQLFAEDLGRELSTLGREVESVALTAGVRGAQIDWEPLGPSRFAGSTLRALRAGMREFDVVVAHGSSTLAATVLAGQGLHTPIVYRNISDPAYWLDSVSRRVRVRALLSRVRHVIALWPAGAQFLVDRLHLSHSDVTVIPNGVSTASFRPPSKAERLDARRHFGIPEGVPLLLYVAAFRTEKHPETAVSALRYLPPDTHLLMLGDGPLRKSVQDLADDVAPSRVVLAGQIEHPELGYWAADVLVLPSEGEGLPAVLIEAGLCGLTAVASTSGGNADIVLDGRTGRIVRPADSVALADAVLEALSGGEFWGASARQHCLASYDIEVVARRWVDVLDKSLRRR